MLKIYAPLIIAIIVPLQLILIGAASLSGDPHPIHLCLTLILEGFVLGIQVICFFFAVRDAELAIGDKQTASATVDDDAPLGVGA